MRLPEVKKKEQVPDISEGWEDDEWEVSQTINTMYLSNILVIISSYSYMYT